MNDGFPISPKVLTFGVVYNIYGMNLSDFHHIRTGAAGVLAAAVLLCGGVNISATTRYHTRMGGFESLRPVGECAVTRADGLMVVDNQSAVPVLILDTVPVHSVDYRCQVRLANAHNKPGKVYKSQAGQIASTVCGMALNASVEGKSYVGIEISCRNTALHDDITDRRLLDVAVVDHSGDSAHVVARTTLDSGVDLLDGFNCIEAVVSGSSLKVRIGAKRLADVLECVLPEARGIIYAGALAGPACKASIERVVVNEKTGQARPVYSNYTVESLNERFAVTQDPYEGYWEYLDRETDDKHVQLGGRYVVALVASDKGGYDIIYISGARVKRAQWHAGMVKGVMTKTVFTDNFRCVWTDATFDQHSDDVFVTFESGAIMNVKFPVYKSQVRFSRMAVKSL